MQNQQDNSDRQFGSYRTFLFIGAVNLVLLALVTTLHLSVRDNLRDAAHERSKWNARLNTYSAIQEGVTQARLQWLQSGQPRMAGRALTQQRVSISELRASIALAIDELRYRPNADYSQPLLANLIELDRQLASLAIDRQPLMRSISQPSPTATLVRIDMHQQAWNRSSELAAKVTGLTRNALVTEPARYDPVSTKLNWAATFVSVAVSLLMMFAICHGCELRRAMEAKNRPLQSIARPSLLSTLKNAVWRTESAG